MSRASEFLCDYVSWIPDCYRQFWPDRPLSYPQGRPGYLIEKMSEEKRALLKTLKSEDLQNVRQDWLGTPKRKGRWA